MDTDCWSKGSEGYYQTLLHRCIDENKEDLGIFLIRAGCDVNSPRKLDSNGKGEKSVDVSAPIHLSATWGLARIVEALLEQGADVNVKVKIFYYGLT